MISHLCLTRAASLPTEALVSSLRRTAEPVRGHAKTRTGLVALIETLMPGEHTR